MNEEKTGEQITSMDESTLEGKSHEGVASPKKLYSTTYGKFRDPPALEFNLNNLKNMKASQYMEGKPRRSLTQQFPYLGSDMFSDQENESLFTSSTRVNSSSPTDSHVTYVDDLLRYVNLNVEEHELFKDINDINEIEVLRDRLVQAKFWTLCHKGNLQQAKDLYFETLTERNMIMDELKGVQERLNIEKNHVMALTEAAAHLSKDRQMDKGDGTEEIDMERRLTTVENMLAQTNMKYAEAMSEKLSLMNLVKYYMNVLSVINPAAVINLSDTERIQAIQPGSPLRLQELSMALKISDPASQTPLNKRSRRKRLGRFKFLTYVSRDQSCDSQKPYPSESFATTFDPQSSARANALAGSYSFTCSRGNGSELVSDNGGDSVRTNTNKSLHVNISPINHPYATNNDKIDKSKSEALVSPHRRKPSREPLHTIRSEHDSNDLENNSSKPKVSSSRSGNWLTNRNNGKTPRIKSNDSPKIPFSPDSSIESNGMVTPISTHESVETHKSHKFYTTSAIKHSTKKLFKMNKHSKS